MGLNPTLFESLWERLWMLPVLVFFFLIGLFLTCTIRFAPFFHLIRILRDFREQKKKTKRNGEIGFYQSMMTNIASAIGAGTITGIACGLMEGGIGSLFWMWVFSLIFMVIKYCEALLGSKYRVKNYQGEYVGGPMQYMEHGLKAKWAGALYACITVFAATCVINVVQAHSVVDAADLLLGVPPMITALFLAAILAIVLLHGVRRVATIVTVVLPIGMFLYVGVAVFVLCHFYAQIPELFSAIYKAAFSGQAASKGFFGATLFSALYTGIERNFICTEAGLGACSIASAATRTPSPVHQAVVISLGSICATTVLCTVTGLVIVLSGAMGECCSEGIPLDGMALVLKAFDMAVPGGRYIVTGISALFAFASVLSWAYYGERAFAYLSREKGIKGYRFLYAFLSIPAAFLSLDQVWQMAGIVSLCMLILNLFALYFLSPEIKEDTLIFLERKTSCS